MGLKNNPIFHFISVSLVDYLNQILFLIIARPIYYSILCTHNNTPVCVRNILATKYGCALTMGMTSKMGTVMSLLPMFRVSANILLKSNT